MIFFGYQLFRKILLNFQTFEDFLVVFFVAYFKLNSSVVSKNSNSLKLVETHLVVSHGVNFCNGFICTCKECTFNVIGGYVPSLSLSLYMYTHTYICIIFYIFVIINNNTRIYWFCILTTVNLLLPHSVCVYKLIQVC